MSNIGIERLKKLEAFGKKKKKKGFVRNKRKISCKFCYFAIIYILGKMTKSDIQSEEAGSVDNHDFKSDTSEYA